jgi:hypothetical protein
MPVCCRFRRLAAAAAWIALPGLALPAAAAAQGWAVELRAGAVASTPLVEDTIARPDWLDARGLPDHELAAVRVSTAVAPMVVVAVTRALQADLGLEVSGGWTPTELVVHGADGKWRAQNLSIGHGLVALRYRPRPRYHVRGGLGAIRYASERAGIFEAGNEVRPVYEVGACGWWPAGGARLTVSVVGQLHGFGTQALRMERGLDGQVYRFALLAGIARGGESP